jgi:hypothetical protein
MTIAERHDRDTERALRRPLAALRAVLDQHSEERLGRMYTKLCRAANTPNRIPAQHFHRTGALLAELSDAITQSAR